jgi:hypothetical protein
MFACFEKRKQKVHQTWCSRTKLISIFFLRKGKEIVSSSWEKDRRLWSQKVKMGFYQMLMNGPDGKWAITTFFFLGLFDFPPSYSPMGGS